MSEVLALGQASMTFACSRVADGALLNCLPERHRVVDAEPLRCCGDDLTASGVWSSDDWGRQSAPLCGVDSLSKLLVTSPRSHSSCSSHLCSAR